ncbi:MAG: MFS transporter family glucose-6-phosphate receptor UhpC [Deltaproteobacteria bacterium CG11_big_fil_rev_8_21_14_0_20_49_13]|nr:MAG: MFS transporter family glucose-6-phosphate receptor UhpC [Deltaproteobacteria bacterium CG11_big_fil_rev_8_21_14_0_20_49_13]
MMKKIWSVLKAQSAIQMISNVEEKNAKYRYWRIRIMYGMMIGYAGFYFVRKNLSIAMPSMLKELDFTKTDLGWVLTGFSIVYGLSKFFSGILADRANPRYFMAIGLILSAIVNVFFGLSNALIFFGICWIFNGWFQGMGWPPCARALTHWYSPTELGTKWGIWNASHQIGGAGIMIFAGYLVQHFGWRSAFFGPAVIAVAVAFIVMNRLRDTPQSLGLPPVEEFRGEADATNGHEDTAESFKEILFKYVLTNKFVWIVSLANCFVYIVRIAILDWAPTFLVEAKNSTIAGAGLKTAGFEIAGIAGAIFAGWISDKIFKGRRGPVNVMFMTAVIFCMVALWLTPAGHPYMDAAILFAVGFVIYGPQMLVGVAAADFASKKAAATATGMTGAFGYLGSALAGIGTGVLVDKYGWNGGFMFFIAAAIIGTILFLFTWTHRSATLEKYHNGKSA